MLDNVSTPGQDDHQSENKGRVQHDSEVDEHNNINDDIQNLR